MEKFFKVREGNKLHDDCVAYSENLPKVRKIYAELCEIVGLECDKFAPYDHELLIVANTATKEKFKTQLMRECRGASAFKKKSEVGKLWVKLLSENNLTVAHKPQLVFYFTVFFLGETSSRLFELNGTWYGSISRDEDFNTLPEWLEEIKASEFYIVIEEENERRAKNAGVTGGKHGKYF